MKLTARRVVLELLSAMGSVPSPVAGICEAGELLGISSASMRVAITRLRATDHLQSIGRGAYRIGPAAAPLMRQTARWRELERRVRRWDGGWIAVHTAGLGRSDRAALRRRERALKMLGLRELTDGLFVRPDNLVGGVAAVRDELRALGLEPAAIVARLDQLDEKREAKARALWDGDALSRSYTRTRQKLTQWLARAARVDARTAARQTFALGRAALHDLVFDPLLPDALCDVAARRALVETMVRFDAAGRRAWYDAFGIKYAISGPVDGPRAARRKR
ncbi:MAG TPA: PaaX family transcriptional regulator C-terminal domain-containing protein [Nannocystaceae bacterium]|nr:PaaX family transcriptional regulator C-terminal domain-containing protein [Nannocystaceae bacterium]